MAANWCSGRWRAWFARASRSRVGAVVLSAVIALASARCIADFLVTPRTPSKTGGNGGPPGAPGAPPEPRLMFVVQPTGGIPGYPLDTVAVAAVDSAGKPASPTIALELIGTPGSATLAGSRQRAAGGVAAFGDLIVDSAGTYRLVALASGFLPDTSQPFGVVEPPVASIDVSPGKASFAALGASVQLSAQARDSQSRPLPVQRIAWSTSDSNVASVSPSGLVVARDNGTATIRASSGNVSGTVEVSVSQAVAGVSVSPSDVSLEDQQSVVVTAAAADSRGNAVRRSLKYAWRSNRTRTATVTVDPSNSARALISRVSDRGAATITATAEGVSGTVTVH